VLGGYAVKLALPHYSQVKKMAFLHPSSEYAQKTANIIISSY
jgi:hypothetical protein